MTDQAEPGSSIGDDSEPFSVRSDRLLIVEGDFDRGFLRELLDRNQRTGVDIDILHGKDKYAARVLTRVLTDKQDRLRWLGLARDADTNAENTFASMVGAMQRVRDVKPWFPIPPRPWEHIAGEENRTATIFVFPPDESTGDIER